MTQEEKELLLRDLCARLSCRVIVTDNRHGNSVITEIDTISDTVYCPDFDEYVPIGKCSPYLRPMSSMNEEERIEFTKLFNKWHDDELFDYIEEGTEFSIWKHKGISPVVFDWLDAHHFDYRGLIHKCLALEAPEDMYNINKK